MNKKHEPQASLAEMLRRAILGKCNRCGWKICCVPHFEEHIAEKHKDIN